MCIRDSVLSINGRLFAPRRFNGSRKIFEAVGGNESVMNLASAIDGRHGEGVAERHIDSRQFNAFALWQQEFSKRVSPADGWSKQASCGLQQAFTDRYGCDDRGLFQTAD